MTIFKTTFYRMFCSILSNLVLISLPSPRGDSCAAEHNGEKGGLVLRLVSFTAVSPSLGSPLWSSGRAQSHVWWIINGCVRRSRNHNPSLAQLPHLRVLCPSAWFSFAVVIHNPKALWACYIHFTRHHVASPWQVGWGLCSGTQADRSSIQISFPWPGEESMVKCPYS